MEIRLFYLVLVSMVTARNTDHELSEHIQRLVRSEDVDGYSLATLHALDTATGQLTGQTKRDVEEHGSDSTSEKSDFTLHLTSGESLRMTLKRRSIDTSAVAVTEHKDGNRETIQVQARDCFFVGPLQEEQGFAALSMCGGRVMGSVTTANRVYDLHMLPDVTDKHSADDVMKLLVTWENDDRALEPFKGNDDDGMEIFDDEDEPDLVEDEDDGEYLRRRSLADRKVTVEIADIMDEYYIKQLQLKNHINETSDIVNLAFNKWNAAAYVLSDESWVTWDITLKLVALDIWRTNPDWYVASGNQTLGNRMGLICKSNYSINYDQVTLHTSKPIVVKHREVGLAWVGGVCKKRNKCSGIRSLRNGLGAELHELGHSLGLPHETKIAACVNSTEDPWRGFMRGNMSHFRRCYRHVLDTSFKKSSRHCLFEETNKDTLHWVFA